MDFTQDTSDVNQIKAYEPGQIIINDTTYQQNLILTPDQIITDWLTGDVSTATLDDYRVILALKTEVVILGTGTEQYFPDTTIINLFADQKIGLEFMNTSAACRTYNILSSDGRQVVAALFV